MSEIGIKDQCYGVEVEMTGITREQAARALADYFGTEPRHTGGGYSTSGAIFLYQYLFVQGFPFQVRVRVLQSKTVVEMPSYFHMYPIQDHTCAKYQPVLNPHHYDRILALKTGIQ